MRASALINGTVCASRGSSAALRRAVSNPIMYDGGSAVPPTFWAQTKKRLETETRTRGFGEGEGGVLAVALFGRSLLDPPPPIEWGNTGKQRAEKAVVSYP